MTPSDRLVLEIVLGAGNVLLLVALLFERGKRKELEHDVETLEAEMDRALAPDDDEAETLPPAA